MLGIGRQRRRDFRGDNKPTRSERGLETALHQSLRLREMAKDSSQKRKIGSAFAGGRLLVAMTAALTAASRSSGCNELLEQPIDLACLLHMRQVSRLLQNVDREA